MVTFILIKFLKKHKFIRIINKFQHFLNGYDSEINFLIDILYLTIKHDDVPNTGY